MQFIKKYIPLFFITLGCFFVMQTHRNDFAILISFFVLAFSGYFMTRKFEFTMGKILLWAFALRLLMFFFFPNLSDDLFRFIWDGAMTMNGHGPYTLLPVEAFENGALSNTDLMQHMNSRNYFSVYPPLMQSIFAMGNIWAGESVYGNILFFRVVILLTELGTILVMGRVLHALNRSVQWSALYAFNPLVIVELTGNLHFEGIMLFFTLISIYVLIYFKHSTKWLAIAGLLFAMGAMTKLTSLLLLPVLLYRLPFMKLLVFTGFTALFCLLMFLPFLSDQLITNFSNSLDLYFRSFEFNASLFYLLNAIGFKITGWNTVYIVGPAMALISFGLILWRTVFRRKKDWRKYFDLALLAYFIYLSFSTTVHPWYLVNILLLSVFTRYRFTAIWTFFVLLSYYMYGNDLQEPTAFLFLEYSVVFVLFYLEWKMPFKISLLWQAVPLFQEDENR